MSASTEMEQVLALKAMGNAGFTKSLHLLTTICRDAARPTMIRYQAILSLKNLALREPAKVSTYIVSQSYLL